MLQERTMGLDALTHIDYPLTGADNISSIRYLHGRLFCSI